MSQPAGQYRMSWCPRCREHTPDAGPVPSCQCRGLLCRTGSTGAASGRFPCSSLPMSTAYGPSVHTASPSFAGRLYKKQLKTALGDQREACYLQRQKHTSCWLHRHMPKFRRLAPLYCQQSTEEDILPRVSQQKRLFSNLDRSMKHETGSVAGSIVLIAGEFMHGV